ncbi:MAG: flagellar biosynthesis protein FlhB [bacterium]|nr:flagellar biosynthesis protein FlhB [bacterium]
MAESGGQEKTEAPTQKKRDDAREEGQVAFSKELSSVALLGSFLLLFWFASSSMLGAYRDAFVHSFTNLDQGEFNPALMEQMVDSIFESATILVGPFFLTALVIGVFASVVQVGFKITGKPLMPKLDKLSPLKGIQRIFSKQALSELFKSLFKMGLIGYIGWYTFIQYDQEMHNLIDQDPVVLLGIVGKITGVFTFRLFLALLILALADYLFQRWDLEQKLMMSKQDVKEEMKQSEGDPQLKARIRQIQQSMSQARMMQEVPKADVVVSNPTHFAIAMKYDRETMVAPQVMAKGADHMALRIIEIAQENGVLVYQSPQVARGLYFQVEVGDGIPEGFYKAVAEILAFVFKAKAKTKGKRR